VMGPCADADAAETRNAAKITRIIVMSVSAPVSASAH
jgi:hypothetical protein